MGNTATFLAGMYVGGFVVLSLGIGAAHWFGVLDFLVWRRQLVQWLKVNGRDTTTVRRRAVELQLMGLSRNNPDLLHQPGSIPIPIPLSPMAFQGNERMRERPSWLDRRPDLRPPNLPPSPSVVPGPAALDGSPTTPSSRVRRADDAQRERDANPPIEDDE